MKLFLLGGSGLLGTAIIKYIKQAKLKIDVTSTYATSEPNHSSSSKIHYIFQSKTDLKSIISYVKTDLIINAAALANVDQCNNDKNLADHLNAFLPLKLAEICHEMRIKLIHISTDHLFEGTSATPYNEESVPNPQNYYAFSKLNGEFNIRSQCKTAIIARTNFFGNKGDPKSFIYKVLNAHQNDRFGLFDDVYFSPLALSEVVQCILRLYEVNYAGIINVTSRDSLTKYEFGKLVLKHAGLPQSGIFCRSIDDMPGLIKRPKMLSLSNKKLLKVLGNSYNFDIKKSITNVLLEP
jgi:dTDP-4-dehydrorhamnose reductase